MVKVTLFSFWKDKEKELGRKITVADVSTATGVHRNTITAYLKGKIDRPDNKVIDKFCGFFKVPPGPVPFLVYERD